MWSFSLFKMGKNFMVVFYLERFNRDGKLDEREIFGEVFEWVKGV